MSGRSTPLGPERVRSWGDTETVLELVEKAGNYVDSKGADLWIDCFQLNGDIYEVNVCDCFLPTIVCRTMPEEEPHSKAPSKTTNTMIEALKTSMGASNYNIVNSGGEETKQLEQLLLPSTSSSPPRQPRQRREFSRWMVPQAARQLGLFRQLVAH